MFEVMADLAIDDARPPARRVAAQFRAEAARIGEPGQPVAARRRAERHDALEREHRVDRLERFRARAERGLQRRDAGRAVALDAEVVVAARVEFEAALAEASERPPVDFGAGLPVVRDAGRRVGGESRLRAAAAIVQRRIEAPVAGRFGMRAAGVVERLLRERRLAVGGVQSVVDRALQERSALPVAIARSAV